MTDTCKLCGDGCLPGHDLCVTHERERLGPRVTIPEDNSRRRRRGRAGR